MTNDRLFGYRLQLFALAAEIGVRLAAVDAAERDRPSPADDVDREVERRQAIDAGALQSGGQCLGYPVAPEFTPSSSQRSSGRPRIRSVAVR